MQCSRLNSLVIALALAGSGMLPGQLPNPLGLPDPLGLTKPKVSAPAPGSSRPVQRPEAGRKRYQRRPNAQDYCQPCGTKTNGKDSKQNHTSRMTGWERMRVGGAVYRAPFTLRPAPADAELNCQYDARQGNDGEENRQCPRTPELIAAPPQQDQPGPPEP